MTWLRPYAQLVRLPNLPTAMADIALAGLAAFWWTVRNGQYDDPAGDAARILMEGSDDQPGPGV